MNKQRMLQGRLSEWLVMQCTQDRVTGSERTKDVYLNQNDRNSVPIFLVPRYACEVLKNTEPLAIGKDFKKHSGESIQ